MAIYGTENPSPGHCARVLTSQLGSGVSRRRFEKGEELFHQGAPARSSFLILEGYIALAVTNEEGRKGVVDLLAAGDLFGTCSVGAQAVRYFTARALSDVTCLEVNRETLLHILRTDNTFMEELLRFETAQRQRSVAMMTSFLFHSSEQRLGHILLQLEDVYDRGATIWNYDDADGNRADPTAPLDGGAHKSASDPPRISHQIFAEMIGTTRPRVTVFFNRFRQAGLFRNNTRVDRRKMQAYLDAFGS